MLTCRNALPQSVCFFVNCDELLAESVLMETAPELFHCRKKQNISLDFKMHIKSKTQLSSLPEIMYYPFNFSERREHV